MLANKELNAIIKAELLARVTPQLKDLGFVPFSRARRGKLPFRYRRECDGRIDMLEFQWDKYHRPLFIINFRPVEDKRDIDRLKEDRREWIGLYCGYYRVSPIGGFFGERWFKLPFFARRFFPHRAAADLAEQVRECVLEVDQFLRGSEPSPRIRAMKPSYGFDDWPDEFFQAPRRMLDGAEAEPQ